MSPNACLLGWWGYLVQLTEKTGRGLDPALEELAERAKFSLHTVSGEDIARVRRAAQEELRILRTHTRGKRFWYRWGLVLY